MRRERRRGRCQLLKIKWFAVANRSKYLRAALNIKRQLAAGGLASERAIARKLLLQLLQYMTLTSGVHWITFFTMLL